MKPRLHAKPTSAHPPLPCMQMGQSILRRVAAGGNQIHQAPVFFGLSSLCCPGLSWCFGGGGWTPAWSKAKTEHEQQLQRPGNIFNQAPEPPQAPPRPSVWWAPPLLVCWRFPDERPACTSGCISPPLAFTPSFLPLIQRKPLSCLHTETWATSS